MSQFIDLSHDFADGMPGFTATCGTSFRFFAEPIKAKGGAASMQICAFAEVT